MIKTLLQQSEAWWQTTTGKTIVKVLRTAFIGALVAYLVWQLQQIGFQALLQAMPKTPSFYLIFIVLYFTLPITEQYIYRLSLNFDFWTGFKIFTKKKVLNQELVGYSGEAYFYWWAQKNLPESPQKIRQVIKDNTIISALTSTLSSIVLLSLFFYFVNANIFDSPFFSRNNIILGAIVLLVLLILTLIFRKKILSVDKKTAQKMFAVHQIRIMWLYSLEILQWTLVIPSIPFFVWFTFLSVRIIASRIPFLPNQELLFISASLEISKYVEISEAAIAGILLTSTVLSKVLNLLFYLLFSFNKETLPKIEKLP